jgi:hypothetical protein
MSGDLRWVGGEEIEFESWRRGRGWRRGIKREREREGEGGIKSEIESGCSHSVDSREARIEVAKGRHQGR